MNKFLIAAICISLVFTIVSCDSKSENGESVNSNLPTTVAAKIDWNYRGISWFSYEAGMTEAKRAKKPIFLVIYADWCPTCKIYGQAFYSRRIVTRSQRFVMIKLNRDEYAKLSKQYSRDGEYIPRTLFLSPEGIFQSKVISKYPNNRYFYDPEDTRDLLMNMDITYEKFKSQ